MKKPIDGEELEADSIKFKVWILAIIPINLQIKFVIVKNAKFSLTEPATKHKKSSGKQGNKTVKAYHHLPFVVINFCHFW